MVSIRNVENRVYIYYLSTVVARFFIQSKQLCLIVICKSIYMRDCLILIELNGLFEKGRIFRFDD